MSEPSKPAVQRPKGWIETEKSPGADASANPDAVSDAATAGRPTDDRMATEMAAARIEKESREPSEDAPSDTETTRNPV